MRGSFKDCSKEVKRREEEEEELFGGEIKEGSRGGVSIDCRSIFVCVGVEVAEYPFSLPTFLLSIVFKSKKSKKKQSLSLLYKSCVLF